MLEKRRKSRNYPRVLLSQDSSGGLLKYIFPPVLCQKDTEMVLTAIEKKQVKKTRG
jgi:hypothetical protein